MSKSIGLALEMAFIKSNSRVNVLLLTHTDIVETVTTIRRILNRFPGVGHNYHNRTIK